MPKELLLDVSEYEAPQPFEKAVQLISQINTGEYIRMLHRKKPLPLIQLLQENGFACVIRTGLQNTWEIIIWNKNDSPVNDYCTANFSQNTSE